MNKEHFRQFNTNRLIHFGFIANLFGLGKKEEPVAEAQKPAEAPVAQAPAVCPKCGGEMTEGHVCPVAEAQPEAQPEAAPAAEEPKVEVEPAPATPEPEAPAAADTPVEQPAEAAPVADATPAEPAAPETEEKTV